ncbi:2571_t:CDS:2, partial [Racocetra fulgida]
ESDDRFRLNFAIERYKRGYQYDVAFTIFESLRKEEYYSNSNDENKAHALDITNHLHDSKDAWDIYQELIEDDE